MKREVLVLTGFLCWTIASAYANDALEAKRAANSPGVSYTETYVAGFAGVNFPQSMGRVPLKPSEVFGGKAGVFSPDAPYLGLELEAFTATPHTKQRNAAQGTDIRMTTTALNVILRWPGEVFQPYIGGGPGVFFMDASDSAGSTSRTKLGINAVGGLKIFMTRNVGIYGSTNTTAPILAPSIRPTWRWPASRSTSGHRPRSEACPDAQEEPQQGSPQGHAADLSLLPPLAPWQS